MKYHYDLTGAAEITRDFPVSGATADIVEGAAVIRGATAGTDSGFAVVATGACADILGVLQELHDYSVSGDSAQTGLTYVKRKVIINPWAIFLAEYDKADDMDVASVSGTTVTITSLEDNIDGGWLLGDDGAASYGGGTTAVYIEYLTASASGNATSKADRSANWTSATDCIKILPLLHQLGKVNTAADKLGTDAAAGSALIVVLENYIQADGIPFEPLDPTKHSGVAMFNPRVFSDIRFRDHALVTLS